MSTQLDKHAYQQLINENIVALNKWMPVHSLEKKHIVEVLLWSVGAIYERNGEKHNKLASSSNEQHTVSTDCDNIKTMSLRSLISRVKCCLFHDYIEIARSGDRSPGGNGLRIISKCRRCNKISKQILYWEGTGHV